MQRQSAKRHPRKEQKPQATAVASAPAHAIHPLCDETLTALPPSIDVAALATFYNSPPKSHVAHAYLLEEARRSLLKYELAQADLEMAADSLARATHLLIEQHGVDSLSPKERSKLEHDILEWYGLLPAEEQGVSENPSKANPRRKVAPHTTSSPQSTMHSHGTQHAH